MEKHPIDSRFKDGLGGFRPQPSADAWARLQSRMNTGEELGTTEKAPEKKRFALWYSIAAAIALILISAGIFRMNFGTENAPAVAVKTIEMSGTNNVNNQVSNPVANNGRPSGNTGVIAKAGPEKETAQNTQPVLASAGKNVQKRNEIPASNHNNAGNLIAKTTIKKPVATQTVSEKMVMPEKPSFANENKELVAVAKPAQPENTSEPALHHPELAPLETAGLEVTVIRGEPKPVLASAAIAENEPSGKKELVKNIFKQARNLKNGEKINLQEIGIEPDSRLAMETRNIKQNLTSTINKVLEL